MTLSLQHILVKKLLCIAYVPPQFTGYIGYNCRKLAQKAVSRVTSIVPAKDNLLGMGRRQIGMRPDRPAARGHCRCPAPRKQN